MSVENKIEKRKDGYYQVTSYYTNHTGVVSIKVEEKKEVEEGDVVYTITRLELIKRRIAITSGIVKNINKDIVNKFSGYYTHVLDIEHKLSAEETQALEEERDYIFIKAPQGAQYFITKNPGLPPIVSVGDIIDNGTIIAIAMVMKKRREIIYGGERSKIAKIYFMNGQQCHQGDKLFGIIPKPIK